MPLRIARYACPCCSGALSLPLEPRQRAPAALACGNAACWTCLGGCAHRAMLVEVVGGRRPARRRAASGGAAFRDGPLARPGPSATAYSVTTLEPPPA